MVGGVREGWLGLKPLKHIGHLENLFPELIARSSIAAITGLVS